MRVAMPKWADIVYEAPDGRALTVALDSAGAPLVAEARTDDWKTARVARRHDSTSSARYELAVRRLEGGRWSHVATVATNLLEPHIQLLPADEILIVDTHCRRDELGREEPNAVVCGRDGSVLRRFVVGDGVDDVQTTASGEIWVAYSDLGTTGDFGLFGWGRLSPAHWVEPIGFGGLLRFDAAGTIRGRFAPSEPLFPIIDCFALNVGDDAVWLSYYPGFPVVRVGENGEVAAFSGLETPVTSIAASGPWLVVNRLIEGERMLTLIARHENGHLTSLEEIELSIDVDQPTAIRRVLARHDMLHAVTDAGWYCMSVDNLARELAV